jgi:hypothetical protein
MRRFSAAGRAADRAVAYPNAGEFLGKALE